MDRELFIDGGWRKAAGGARLEIRDPATGKRVGNTALAATDVDRAVAAAQRAQPIWAESHADERRIMLKAAGLIEKRADATAVMLTREQGKPVPDSVKEIGFGVRVLRYLCRGGPARRRQYAAELAAPSAQPGAKRSGRCGRFDRAVELSSRYLLPEDRSGAGRRLPDGNEAAARDAACHRDDR